jgi:hypothetical protein
MAEHSKPYLLRLTPEQDARIARVALECGTTRANLLRSYVDSLLTLEEKTARHIKNVASYKALAESGGFEDEDLYPSK